MLKFLIPFAVLLNFAACRFVDENDGKFCEAETERFKFCTETYANFTRDLVETRKELIKFSSTVSPLESQLGGEFKKSLKCIGDLECKGERKLVKFLLDTLDFYTDRKIEAQECMEDKDISQSLGNCFVSHKKFPLPKGFSSTVVLCVKKVLDSTDCSTEQKVGLERGGRAVADLYDQSDMVFGDENYAKNFDLKFDPRKYGL
ncbi:Protein CBG06605 [Caenorhabditis briggsae]|uniref:Protein CBG06340 n=2 Tax=Caenorhabditis briggsae TaxID=6238 RepID=G2J6K4_CAEBR|nr:Protein CBG06340 [Caenorhabditis briggsae]XP_002647523.1 Protein CBG06605 [Caenorhabditis briggsae]ULT87858.1 hypothetical protein L3Y34_007202 [Caenorhabditis briggsae]CAP26664.1 Protein CBG06340 [Caenorhabditis briggsae]CAP26887.1 Protein CBG06605 [Caenorhabditis briggsae]